MAPTGSGQANESSTREVPLDDFPFDRLRLQPDEQAQWKALGWAPHRSTQYAIVLTDRALHLRSAIWFARWRSIPLIQVRNVVFNDSWWCPSLRVETTARSEVLRTPWDVRDEMDLDRTNLRTATALVRNALNGGANVAQSPRS
jgi:hypothetical protein